MKKKEILIPKTVILLIFIILVVTLTLLFKSIAFSKKTIDSGLEGLDISKSKNYEIPISYYYYGIQNKNLDAFLKAYPEFMNVKNRFSQNDFDKFYDVFKDECGENINLTYKITNVTQCSESQLAELENYFKENYMVDVKPDSAYAVNITETFSGDKKEVETLKTQTIFQYNGNWYIK